MKLLSILHSRVLAIFVPALIVGLAISFDSVRADPPDDPPSFSHPLDFTNEFFPFVPGTVKEYSGNDHGTKVKAIDIYSDDTRVFTWNNIAVVARILIEMAYEDDELVEVSQNYFAQADDGTVYYFGEVVNNYDENGDIDNHDGSWLVGDPDDPPDADIATDPAPNVFMLNNPLTTDLPYHSEDLPPDIEEINVVQDDDKNVTVHGTHYTGAVKISGTSGGETEYKYYASGVGVVKVHTQGDNLRLDEIIPPPED